MTGRGPKRWSIFTHADLPPLSGRPPSAPLREPLPDGLVPGVPPLPTIEAERIDRQRKVAARIRGVLGQVDGNQRRQMLADRALLIETADSADEVLVLLDEVERLGVKVRRRER